MFYPRQSAFINATTGHINRHLLLKVQDQMLADLVSDESPFRGSETAVFLLYSHMVEGTRKLSGVPFIGGTNAIPEGSTLMT